MLTKRKVSLVSSFNTPDTYNVVAQRCRNLIAIWSPCQSTYSLGIYIKNSEIFFLSMREKGKLSRIGIQNLYGAIKRALRSDMLSVR